MSNKCKECGCVCKQCNRKDVKHSDMHLHEEIENLRQCLAERDNHIVTMETHFLNEAEKFPNGELASLKEEILVWEDKYARLYEAHKRVQKVNQNLEDKLLRIVDKCETEKSAFTKDIATLSHRLAEANYTIHQLTQDNEKYRNDVNLAIQLLQCKPSNFVGQKYETLPSEVQAKVRAYVSQKGPNNNEMPNFTEIRSITVPISTFPPTAMVYNIAKPVVNKQDSSSDDDSKSPVDTVSAAIMAKILEDREKERIFTRHCNTCMCHRSILKVDTESQTTPELSEGAVNITKDYFNKCDNADFKYAKSSKESLKPDSREANFINNNSNNKGRSQLNDINVKTANFYGAKESMETNNYSVNVDKSKIGNNFKSEDKNLMNLKNSILLKSAPNAPKDQTNLNDQEKLNVINERLWKNSWTSAKVTPPSAKENPVQLDVINERVWRHNNISSGSGKPPEKPIEPTRITTVIEVRSPDELSSPSEKTRTETSPSFSGDSILISSSDPSSLSSDVAASQQQQQQQPQQQNLTSQSSGRKERPPSGPRSCRMRITPGSKNILLDNVDAYQTVLYTSGCSRPNTALVHVGKTSSRPGRSTSVSSEENDSSHLQRVAQWVDTLAQNDSNGQQQESPPDSTNSAQNSLLGSLIARTPRPLGINVLDRQQAEEQRDLMSFEALDDDDDDDDDEHAKLEFGQIDNIGQQVQENYLKLAANLDSAQGPRVPDYTEIDMMTIEEYRREQKLRQKGSHAKFTSRT